MQLIPLDWSAPKQVNTKFGPRVLRTAPATSAFWELWRNEKEDLKKAGYSCGKDDHGVWEVKHWGRDEVAEVIAEKTVELSRATDADVELPVPAGLEYLPYQKAGIAFGAEREATLIADEMGLGKTIQAIGIANATNAQRILVVCPASLRLNWQREMDKWLVNKELNVEVITSKDQFPTIGVNVIIVNYDILKKFFSELRSVEWDLVVFDEAHYCKNPKALRTAQCFGRAKSRTVKEPIAPITGKRRVLLTGTPLKNRPIELFPLLNYLSPREWPNFFMYAKAYCNAHKNRFGWDFTGASNLDELQRKLRGSFMVRRLKQDVLTELPAKQRQVISVPANGAQEIVDAELRTYAEWEAAKASGDQEQIKLKFAELAHARLNTSRAKLPHVIERLLDVDGKVVVMCRHHEIVNKLVTALEDEGHKVVTLTGKNSLEERQVAVDTFQADPSVQYFVGTIQAAGVGITLTAAQHVVFAELEWTPADISQAEDRCHRIGQRGSVLVQHIILDGSLDDRMLLAIMQKQRIADKALDAAPEPQAVEPARPHREFKMPEPKAIDAMSAELKASIHRAVQMVAGVCDGARERDMQGFNGTDTHFGHSLARQEKLSDKQALAALKMMRKYRRQIDPDLYDSLYGGKDEEE